MALDSMSRLAIKRMRWIGIAILIIGVVSFAFGIVLLDSANTVQDEEVEQLEMELSPTSINELKDLREEIRDNRHEIVEPEDVRTFIEGYLAGLALTGDNPSADDFKWEAWDGLLLQEKGTSVALLTLGTAEMISYAGIGALVLSAGLIIVGLLVILLSPGINQIRKSLAEISDAK